MKKLIVFAAAALLSANSVSSVLAMTAYGDGSRENNYIESEHPNIGHYGNFTPTSGYGDGSQDNNYHFRKDGNRGQKNLQNKRIQLKDRPSDHFGDASPRK